MSANSNQAIIELLVKDSASGEIVKVSTSLGALKKAAGDAGEAMKSAGPSSEKMGAEYAASVAAMKQFGTAQDAVNKKFYEQEQSMSGGRREFTRTGREAIYALSAISGKAGEANSGLRELTGAATELGSAFLYGTGVTGAIVGIALAVGAVAAALDTTTPQTKAFWASVDDATKADNAVDGLKAISGATTEQAETALAAIKVNKDYARSFKEIRGQGKDTTDWLKSIGTTAADLTKIIAGAIQVDALFVEMKLKGASEQEIQTAAAEKFREATIGITKAQYDALAAEVALAPAIIENTRQMDLWKKAVIGVADEQDALTTKLGELKTAHTATLKNFGYDWSEATRKSGIERVRIEADATEKINQLNVQLGQKIVDIQANTVRQIQDIEFANTRKLSEDYYQYARTIEALNRDITKSGIASAKERTKAEDDFGKSVAKISADQQSQATDVEEKRQAALEGVRAKYGTLQLDQGKVYSEAELLTRKGFLEAQSQEEATRVNSDYDKQVAKLKKESDARRADAAQAKSERLAALTESEAATKEEQDYRRGQANQTYAHTKDLADQNLRDQIDRAQRAAEDQITQARRASAEQILATNDAKTKQLAATATALAETERGINHQRDVENLAYADNLQKAKGASAAKIQLLKDFSTEDEKFTKARLKLEGGVADELIIKEKELWNLRNGNYIPNAPSYRGARDYGGYADQTWHAAGGDFWVNRPTLFGAGEAGPERVTITPMGQSGGGKSITIQFLGAIYATTPAAAETAGRGLGRGIADALRAKGMAL